MITWHVHPDGLHIWKDGAHVGVIEARYFAVLAFHMLDVLRRGPQA